MGAPVALFYGFIGGIGAWPHFTMLHFIGALLGRYHFARRYGEAKYGVGNRLWRGMLDLVGVRWLKARYIDPDNVIEVSAVRVKPAVSGDPAQELSTLDSRSARKRS